MFSVECQAEGSTRPEAQGLGGLVFWKAQGGVGSTKRVSWRAPEGVGSSNKVFWRAPEGGGSTKGRFSALEASRKHWIDKTSSLEDPWQGDASERTAPQLPAYRPLESSFFHSLVLRMEN